MLSPRHWPTAAGTPPAWAGGAGVLWLAAVTACGSAAAPAPTLPLRIQVTGVGYEWHVRYPGPDRVPGTADDVTGTGDLHVPVNTPVEVHLESRDYIYRFRIPDLDVNEVAVPELQFSARFEARSVGTLPLKGDQMCGFQHDSLLGRVIVHEARDFEAWLARRAHDAAARPRSPVPDAASYAANARAWSSR